MTPADLHRRGYTLAELRTHYGLTRAQLGALAGVSYATIARWEGAGLVPEAAIAALERADEAPPTRAPGRPSTGAARRGRVMLALGPEAMAVLERVPAGERSRWVEGLILSSTPPADGR